MERISKKEASKLKVLESRLGAQGNQYSFLKEGLRLL